MSCPVPFLSAADFPPTGGCEYSVSDIMGKIIDGNLADLPGRLCSAVTSTLTCCLPCNKQKWTYTNEFNRNLDVAFWLNVPSLIALVLLLITFAALPAKQSHRHYLNIGLCVGLSLLCIAFVIPLASRPDYCYNVITPRDMYSSTQCGFSGAFFIAGTLTATTWGTSILVIPAEAL
ncbi:unnamed protein product [Zymoseptoria tritici ST99CH_1E4]|uniref:Uncharacterized protein n=1 Tax=Zymoseptoria tritici ST99CH_1E4 TaxID=1276532 RepID=A0A2H1G3E7_ZYMTR|nr:unnamed protein product [Zymoseptoria tritici ST99CH_1E4]